MLHVVAEITVRPGRRDDFLREFRQVMPAVLAERGCREYRPVVDEPLGLAVQPPERTDLVTVIEKWDDAEALRAHLAAPHMTAYRERVKELVGGVRLLVMRDSG